ncbi:MAG: transposase [Sedimentisphaerales bacterium]|nr:transposase [Sedimentisphaerales bacterium]
MDAILSSQGIEIKRTPVHAPNANAYAERFVREARETLDNLIIFREGQLYRTLKKIERHHNSERPHQGIDNTIPLGYDYPEAPALPEDVRCRSDLGGLLRHYHVEKDAA